MSLNAETLGLRWLTPIRTSAGIRAGMVCPNCQEVRMLPFGPEPASEPVDWVERHRACGPERVCSSCGDTSGDYYHECPK